jgi:hypothetical protein
MINSGGLLLKKAFMSGLFQQLYKILFALFYLIVQKILFSKQFGMQLKGHSLNRRELHIQAIH